MWQPQPNVDGAARNSLANERTFLSWFRTGVTLITLGAAVIRFKLVKHSNASGFVLLGMGMALIYAGVYQYVRVQRMLQKMEFHPNRVGVWLLVAATFVVAALLIVINAIN